VPEETHTIVATVEQNGRPRSRRIVARFTAPKPAKATRPRKLKARRAGTRVNVTWRKVAGAQRYDVTVSRADGSRALTRTRRPRLVLKRATDVRRVSVRALSVDGKLGPAASASVQRARKRTR
jgi:hypothetical protein